MYQVTFTVWFTVILNVLIAPSVSLTGDCGAKLVMLGLPGGNAVTFHIQVCLTLPLELLANALTFQMPAFALVLV
jgi:hypothetical protein